MVIIFTDISGQLFGPNIDGLFGFLTLENGADRLSRNVGKELLLYAV